jgi:hypothetical protein
MRTCMLAAMMAGLLVTASNLVAGEGCNCNAGASASGNCDPCDPCACRNGCGCGLFGHHCECPIDGLDRFANYGCNGSYNYPVPPLYTYHWPGMYKQVRMTDYHSPWRFPPLKRYEDEPLPTIEVPAPRAAAGPRLLRPVSLGGVDSSNPVAAKKTWHTEIEPLSSRLSR